jgi:hypothetical protein
MATGISPNEIWSSVRGDSGTQLSRTHVFGCPVYVLDAALQDGKKIPKWNPRARLGLFLGFSDVHSSQVPLVLNTQTGKISPQFHVIFDDKFATVHSLPPDQPLTEQWANIFRLGRECFLDIDYDANDNPILPPLTDIIQSYARNKADQQVIQDTALDGLHDSSHPLNTGPEGVTFENPEGDTALDGFNNSSHPPHTVPEGVPVKATDHNHPPHTVPEGVPEGATDHTQVDAPPPAHQNNRPRRNVGTYKDGPANIRKFPIDGESYEFAFNIKVINEWEHPIPSVLNKGRITMDYHPNQKICKESIAEYYLLQDPWFDDPTCVSAINDNFVLDSWESDGYYFNEISASSVLTARNKTSKYNDDNPSFDTATRGPFQEEFWQAMRVELNTLINDFDCWEYVPNPGHNVLPSTWAFKIKRYPDGRVKKFKARFCARGDRQQEGIDYFETWAPVVQWSTVRIVMILAAKLGLISVQCDITAAFIHGRVQETIYVHQPRGFHRGQGDEVLKLKRTLYGLKQSPRYFFKYFTERLLKQGLTASKFDPCLFMSKTLIVIIYVDDILIYGKNDEEINDFIERMKQEDVALHREGTAEGYLGVDIQREGNSITLRQEGLTKRIISALGLDSKLSTSVATPAEKAALGRDLDGPVASGSINYPSVIGMLLYLGHSRPDISFATHQCARYTHSPKQSHENALIRIGRYLKGTLDKGLILTPSDSLKIDCYPDADFAGLWNRDEKHDPHCVRSRTGYVINLSNCPVLWKSKLQTEIALSTMEAEYVALSASCKDLFPLIDITKEICSNFGPQFNLHLRDITNMHIKIHEDNTGALTLGKLEPRRMTPRSKHYAIKYHWFREQIGPRRIDLVKISSEDQLGDLFTKGLDRIIFTRLRKKLMGW